MRVHNEKTRKVPLKASSDTYRENKTPTLIQLSSFEIRPTMINKFLDYLLNNFSMGNS